MLLPDLNYDTLLLIVERVIAPLVMQFAARYLPAFPKRKKDVATQRDQAPVVIVVIAEKRNQ